MVFVRYKLCHSLLLSGLWHFSHLLFPQAAQFRNPLLLLFRQCRLLTSLLPDLTLFTSCISTERRAFVCCAHPCSQEPVSPGALDTLRRRDPQICTGTEETTVERRKKKKEKRGFWSCLPYKGCLTVSTWHQKPLTQLLLGGTVAAVTAEISPGQIFMWATCSQWNHFEQQDSFLQSEEIGTLTPATIYFISVLRVMKGTIFLTICLTERHILCVDQFQRANGKVHITSPAVKAFVNIIIIKEA